MSAHAPSYYAATAKPFPAQPRLVGDINADVVVVGGGFTGLSAALHCAEAGYSVVLLEAGQIGCAASGRNGGQLIPGLRWGAVELAGLEIQTGEAIPQLLALRTGFNGALVLLAAVDEHVGYLCIDLLSVRDS